MTSHPEAQPGYAQGAPAGKPSRPGTLTAAIGLAALTALVAIIDGILFITGGQDVAIDALGAEPYAELDGLSKVLVDEAAGTLSTRAYLTIGAAVLLLLFGVLMSKAATWTRVLSTIVAVVVFGMGMRLFSDIGTGLMQGLGALASVLALVTIVLIWLPANGRYGKSLKASA